MLHLLLVFWYQFIFFHQKKSGKRVFLPCPRRNIKTASDIPGGLCLSDCLKFETNAIDHRKITDDRTTKRKV